MRTQLKTTMMTLFAALFFFTAAAFAAPQATCPVMGGTVNKDLYADYKGKRVYFCCNACPPVFNKDPEKYIKKLEEMGQEVETIPEKEG